MSDRMSDKKISEALLSVILGAAAIVLSFMPLEVQVLGVVAGIAGIVMVRRAKRTEYTKDMTITIGMVLSITGLALCLIAPALALVANIIQLFV